MDQSLDTGLVQMTQVGGGLSGLLAHHQGLWSDQAEGIDDDFAFDGLDGIDDDGDGARGELLKGLLGVDVDGGEPAAETGVRVVPADDCLGSVRALASEANITRWQSNRIVPPSLP